VLLKDDVTATCVEAEREESTAVDCNFERVNQRAFRLGMSLERTKFEIKIAGIHSKP